MELSIPTQNFIVHWGEMGTRWGINRTVAQIHALLYISSEPIDAEEISETLSIARSTCSTGLRELQGWGLAKVVHVLGDRREHFETIDDVWEMFRIVIDGRKRKEMDPTLGLLRDTIAEMSKDKNVDQFAKSKLSEMLDFFETMIGLYEQIQKLSLKSLIRIAKSSNLFNKLP